MKDLYRQQVFKHLGFMVNIKCKCCNWTIGKSKKRNRQIVNKQARASLKQELKRTLKNERY